MSTILQTLIDNAGWLSTAVVGVMFFRYRKRKEAASTTSAEADAIKNIIEGSQMLDERTEKLLKQQDTLHNKEIQIIGKRIERIEVNEKRQEERISALEAEVRDRDKKIGKRDYIIRQATKCKLAKSHDECVVLNTVSEMDSAKDEKIRIRSNIK